jgi:hypothetical protein
VSQLTIKQKQSFVDTAKNRLDLRTSSSDRGRERDSQLAPQQATVINRRRPTTTCSASSRI